MYGIFGGVMWDHTWEPTSPPHPKGRSPNKKKIVVSRILHPTNTTRTNPIKNILDLMGCSSLSFLFEISSDSVAFDSVLLFPIWVSKWLDLMECRVLICLWPVRLFLFSCEVRLNRVVLRLSSWREIILHFSTHVLKAPGISR